MADRWNVGAATGLGSLPGTSADEAARSVAGELPELPYVAELPDRGVGADMVGRAIGLLVDIFGEVVPSGWRISRRPGRDTRRAKDFHSWDLDAAEQHFAGAARVKVQLCGPWTLAASLELPSGNRALTDLGAVADLGQSLAEGAGAQLAELARRLPGTELILQLDEPGLPAVLAGSLPTASGFGTVRPVDPAVVRGQLATFSESLPALPRLVHCCHPDVPLTLLREAGFEAFALDVTKVGSGAVRLDPIGEAIEAGAVLLAGLVPATRPAGAPKSLRDWAAPLLELWDRLGFRRADLTQVVPTPTCGLAGASAAWSIEAMRLSRELARAFQDPPAGW